MYYALRKIKRGYYETTIIELARPPYAKGSTVVLDRYVEEVERIIRERPAEWLWSHNRWKTRHLERDEVVQSSSFPPADVQE
jgi:KDO2-lipid IV(A) lauroyltransferase